MTKIKNKFRGSERDAYYEQLEEELKNRNAPEDNQDLEDDSPDKLEGFSQENKPKDKDSDVDWKKRYADLQRHLSSLEKKWDEKERDLANELEAEKAKASLPKNLTPEKLEEWEKKFPDVAAIIDHRAKQIAKQLATNLEEKVVSLEKNKQVMDQERAILQLISMHNDFIEIRDSDEFNDWIVEQPEWMADAIYKPEDFSDKSVKNASKVIKFFKLDSGWGEKAPKKTPKNKDTSAAESVTRKGSNLPDDVDGQPEFSESQVAKMSSKEFEAKMDKILAAKRSGRFDYDLSGAAQ